MEHYLRQQNYQLKNEITDLKNAFDLNRDILKLLNNYSTKTDPHYNLLMQIITRLTSVNNQAMLNNIDLIHQKNILKQQNFNLNEQLNLLQTRFNNQIEANKANNLPNQSKMVMQEQFNSLSRELMAANEERIVKQQQILHWKQQYHQLVAFRNQKEQKILEQPLKGNYTDKIKRKYESSQPFKYQLLNRQLQRQNKKLKLHIQQLQSRLIIFIKAYNLENDLDKQNQLRQSSVPFFEHEREEIRLLKYALNDIHLQKQEEQCVLTITQRFKHKDTQKQGKSLQRNNSWPKHATTQDTPPETKSPKMEEREDEFSNHQRY